MYIIYTYMQFCMHCFIELHRFRKKKNHEEEQLES